MKSLSILVLVIFSIAFFSCGAGNKHSSAAKQKKQQKINKRHGYHRAISSKRR